MIGCLRTRVRKQPIIALYFELSASSQSLRFILSLRMNSSSTTSGPGNSTTACHRRTHGSVRKIHGTVTLTQQQEHNEVIQSELSLFLIKMIAKLMRPLRTTAQKEDPTQHIRTQWEQQQTMNE